MADSRPKTAVLYGGTSAESEISKLTGMAVMGALQERGYDVVGIDAGGEFIRELRQNNVEVAFLALHGEFGEDGQIQAILTREGIPYTGSGVDASKLGMDKAASKRVMAERGVPTPRFCLACVDDDLEAVAREAALLGYPLVAKPRCGGSSIGMSVVKRPAELDAAIAKSRAFEPDVLLEEFIDGRELTVGVMCGTPLPIVEIVCEGTYDYNNKYLAGRTQYHVNPKLSGAVARAVQDVGVATYRCLGCEGAARVDIRLDRADRPWVLEINTIPGMTATSLLPKAAQAAGIEFPELCEMILTDALRRHRPVMGVEQTGDDVGEKRASA
ncbi:MAG TPA: D-alanine--D-alanine ligase [Planctomycetota bacterium]|nr:D-alanine--D-alanine ligase [Planctomycetota bacterium]